MPSIFFLQLLQANLSKISIYFGGVSTAVSDAILA